MKKIIITSILLAFFFVCKAQIKNYHLIIKDNPIVFTGGTSDVILSISGDGKEIIVKDSLFAIQELARIFLQNSKDHQLLNKRFFAAMSILSCVSTNGTVAVKDRKKFKTAIADFKAITVLK